MAVNPTSPSNFRINVNKSSKTTDNIGKVNAINNQIEMTGELLSKTIEQEFSENYASEKVIELGSVKQDFSPDIDLKPYEDRLKEIKERSETQREEVTNLAIFIASEFPKLPYFLDYSSGHDGSSLEGLGWTEEVIQREDGTYDTRTLDCSGLINWCYANSNLVIPGYGVTTDYYSIAQNVSPLVGNDLSNVKPGDFAYTGENGGHIGVIVGVNEKDKTITVVHTSGSGEGVNITAISTETGLIVSDDTGSANVDRTGTDNYFNEILHMQYEGE